MDNKWAIYLLAVILSLALFLLVDWLNYACWNYVMPVFGLPQLTFPQATALFFLLWSWFGGINAASRSVANGRRNG